MQWGMQASSSTWLWWTSLLQTSPPSASATASAFRPAAMSVCFWALAAWQSWPYGPEAGACSTHRPSHASLQLCCGAAVSPILASVSSTPERSSQSIESPLGFTAECFKIALLVKISEGLSKAWTSLAWLQGSSAHITGSTALFSLQ